MFQALKFRGTQSTKWPPSLPRFYLLQKHKYYIQILTLITDSGISNFLFRQENRAISKYLDHLGFNILNFTFKKSVVFIFIFHEQITITEYKKVTTSTEELYPTNETNLLKTYYFLTHFMLLIFSIPLKTSDQKIDQWHEMGYLENKSWKDNNICNNNGY